MSIELKDVSYCYDPDTPDARYALEGISLKIDRRQRIGIIGHTGSGKSTLIQHMNGLLKPTSGTVLFNGRDIWEEGYSRKELRSRVGLVFQYPEYQLFEETVIKDVSFGPRNLGLAEEEIQRRCREALEITGLTESQYELSPFELSGGQKRRAAIAGVLAMEPEILILDEPTAGLDPRGRDDIFECLRMLHEKRGITIVLVSHSMEDVAAFAERIIVVDEGKIAFDAPPSQIFTDIDRLEKMGLAVPEVTYLMYRLRQEGYDVPEDVITADQAARAIFDLWKGPGL